MGSKRTLPACIVHLHTLCVHSSDSRQMFGLAVRLVTMGHLCSSTSYAFTSSFLIV